MARDLEHLDLPQVQAPIARRRYGGGASVVRESPAQHAAKLAADAAEVTRVQHARVRPAGATPALIFKLRVHPKAELDADTLGRFGLSLVARDEDKTLVVFSSDEDLAVFRDRVATYGSPTGHKYGEVGGIEGLDPLTAADRTGPRLARRPIEAGQGQVPVDVELWHSGTVPGAWERLGELRAVVEQAGGRVTDDLATTDLVVARCHADAALIVMLLDLDIVREVDRMPEVAFARLQALGVDVGDLPEIDEAPQDATGVLILDSGITANHPILAPAVGDAQVFPAELGVRDGHGAADGDQRLHGHGTAVAGFATWGRPHEVVTDGRAQPQVTLLSARVLDDQAQYDPDMLVEHQLEAAVRYFLDAYPTCRVINLSLGDDRMIFPAGGRQTRLAARIDELAYALQPRNVLFTVCTGNYGFDPLADQYPKVLLERRAALIEPATAALALTVGGVSAGGHPARMKEWATRRAIAGDEGHPSPFTRAGFGVGGMIKPEVVEAAGDWAEDARRPSSVDVTDPGLGLPTTNRDFAPPEGRLMRAVSGTSFAAPAVAHAAALVFNRYPDATPNLVRALLADSALLPGDRPAPFDADHDDDRVLRVYGYGRPDVERAAASDHNDVLLVAESTIAPDAFQLFEVPFLPDDFLARDGDRTISVALAFDPPTRRTRGDSYLGLSMQCHLFRNSAMGEVAASFRDWRAAPPGDSEQQLEQSLSTVPASRRVDLAPGPQRRNKGTLQRGLARVKTRAWTYDGGPLILAVSCLRKWAPPELNAQRYAVVMSLKHADPRANLHAPLRARLRPRVRARVR